MPPHARTAGDAADAAADEHAAVGEDAVPVAGTADDPAGEDGARAARSGGDASPEGELARALDAAVAAVAGTRREGQVLMAEAVASALAGGDHLLVQAGTGTGKSLAYLVPAMLHATSADRRVVVATATLALQHQLVARDLPRVADALEPVLGRRPTYAVLKGRHNYLCLDRLHRGAADSPDDQAALFAAPTTVLGRQAKKLREWADGTETGDRDDVPFAVDGRVWRALSVSGRECVGAAKCPYGEECFAEQARNRAKESQVVVTNHAMLAIHTLEDVPVLPEHDAVVVDEGHELSDRATQAVTAELAAAMVERAAQRARKQLDDDGYDRLESAAEGLATELTALAESGGRRIERVEGGLALALASVRDSCHAAIGAMSSSENRDRAKADPEAGAALQRAKGLLGEVHDVASALLSLDERRRRVARRRRAARAPVLRIAPLSVARVLRSELFDRTRVVVTSATLTLGGSFQPLARRTACPPRSAAGPASTSAARSTMRGKGSCTCRARRAPRPRRRRAAGAGRARRPGRRRRRPNPRAVLLLARGGAGRRAPGRDAAGPAAGPRHRADRRPVLVQQRGDAVAELVRRFADDPRSVLLGTLSLWQGVDVPGSACTLVVIDRIPFPRPNEPLTAARSKAAEAAGGNGSRPCRCRGRRCCSPRAWAG